MSNEKQGIDDAIAGKDMSDDPKWTQQQREDYQAAYSNTKKKQQTGQM